MSERTTRRDRDGELVDVDPGDDVHACASGWLEPDPSDREERPRVCPICATDRARRLARQHNRTHSGFPDHWTPSSRRTA